MNIQNKISLVSLLMLGIACGAKPTTTAVLQSIRAYSVGLKEMAGNQLYLNDSVDAIGADGTSEIVVTPELAAAQVKLTTATSNLASANQTLADAQAAATAALATAKASTQKALDLAKAAKSDASLKDQALISDTKARADGALVDVADLALSKAESAQLIAADAVVQAQKVVVAQGGDIAEISSDASAAADAVVKAQADLVLAQNALVAAQDASTQAQADVKTAKADAKTLATAAKNDPTLQALADGAAANVDDAVLKAAAAADAQTSAAADVAKAEAAVTAATGVAAGGVAGGGAVAGDTEVVDGAVVDPVTESDCQPKRIGQMVAQLFATLDVNADDTLDLTEFLKITEIKNGAGSNGVLNADQLAALQVKLTAKFTQFAGADNLMTDVELAAFLKGQKGRVGKMRKHLGQAGTTTRALTAEQLLAKFDVNKDGVIDLAELTAIKASLAAKKAP